MNQRLKIGIILGSSRRGRKSPQVGEWVKSIADARQDADYEMVDIADYKLPMYGEGDDNDPGVAAWGRKIDELDGFVFIVPEYNHSIPAVLKNALDSAYKEWNDKAAGIISYGSTGGARAAEHLRGILGELHVADVRVHPTLSIFTDFQDFEHFAPAELHLENVNNMLSQVIGWSTALRSLRKQAKVK